MPYVMVPVPEDFVADVMQFILNRVERDSLEEWTEEAGSSFFAAIDEPSRAAMAATARGVVARAPVSEAEAADALQLNQRDIVRIVSELNEVAQSKNLPHPIVMKAETKSTASGRTTEVRVLVMREELAELILEVDRAHLAESDPFGPGPS